MLIEQSEVAWREEDQQDIVSGGDAKSGQEKE
jgi:hypothetical protein